MALLATADQLRRAETLTHERMAVPMLLLMEAAGRGSAELLRQTYSHVSRYLVLCGAGNNGGDGLVVARYLHRAGKDVWVIIAGELGHFGPDALTNFTIVQRMGIRWSDYDASLWNEIKSHLREGTVVVDALLGIGATGKLRPPVLDLVEKFKGLPVPVVALDLPSGLNADTGAVESAPLLAQHTLTYGLAKLCHYVSPASSYCGEIHVVDVGLDAATISAMNLQHQLLDAAWVSTVHHHRDALTYKNTYGHVLVVGGSRGKGGAPALAAQAVLEMGGGLATAVIPGTAESAFHRRGLETMSAAFGTQQTTELTAEAAPLAITQLTGKAAVVIGPGMGATAATRAFFEQFVPHVKVPLVIDADALNLLAEYPELWPLVPKLSVLTPHPGEMARLVMQNSQQVQSHRLESARALARAREMIVVLKGAGTLIAHPDGRVLVNATGNPGMATAGAGDVLAGAIAGLIGQGYEPFVAAGLAVHVHGRAGDLASGEYGQEGVTASKLSRSLGRALKSILYSA